MDMKQRLAGFETVLKMHRSSGDLYEERDGRWRQWDQLSAEAKTGYIARDAAFYDVPFERFAQAIRDMVENEPGPVRGEAYLRLALSNHKELHEVESLLPDNLGMDAISLVDRVSEVVDWYAGWAPGSTDMHLESPVSDRKGLAEGAEKRPGLTEIVSDTGKKDAYDALLDQLARAGESKSKEKDRGIER